MTCQSPELTDPTGCPLEAPSEHYTVCVSSPVGLPRCRSGTLVWTRPPPYMSCSCRTPRPPASAAAVTGRPAADRGRSTDTCHSPTWTDPPTLLFSRKAVKKRKEMTTGYSTDFLLCHSGGGVEYLKPLPDGLQQVRYQRVVPQVGEPNPGSFHIHGTGKEKTRTCRTTERSRPNMWFWNPLTSDP